jgi:dTDP-4-amino-4,6-dideoxygalactose transaminase
MTKVIIPLQDFRAQYESLRDELAIALASVLERQDFVLGREVQELEEEMARVCGTRHAVACASGSDALLLALMALDIGPGDEVLAPAFTFFATAAAPARLGARPIFADIDPASFNVSPGSAEKAAAGHARLRAAIPVDLFGQVADLEGIQAALGPGVALVEDAAQAILATRGGRLAGSFGRAGALSFYPTKNLGAMGEAGMLTTGDDELAGRLRRLRVHGEKQRYYHEEIGINSRLDTLQAAVLLVKLRKLEQWTAARECAAERYNRLFVQAGLAEPGATYPTPERPAVVPARTPAAESRHVYHQYTIRAQERDGLRTALDAGGIRTGLYYPVPLHLQPCFAQFGGRPGGCPEAERAAAEVLSLPMFAEITPEQQQRVVESIAGFYGK